MKYDVYSIAQIFVHSIIKYLDDATENANGF